MDAISIPFLVVIAIVVLYLLNSIKILREYERGVIFRLGRALPQPKGPGIILVLGPRRRRSGRKPEPDSGRIGG